ncbi:MAG: adenylate/guanylate cyclase domain-containing protein [Bdellovibrionota bacterium]
MILKKYLLKSIRPIGATLILIVAFLCLISAEFYGQVDEDSVLKKVLNYTIAFESRFYDYRMRKGIEKHEQSKEVVLVEIDDYSLSTLGHWPLSRTVYADLLGKMKTFGAKVVAFDILFPEKSPTEGLDQKLGQSFKKFQEDDRRAFVGYTILEVEAPDQEKLKEFPTELLNDTINTKQEADLTAVAISEYNYPIQEIVSSDVGLGFITQGSDTDGIFRDYHLLANVEQIYVGSLGLNAFEAWSGKKHTIEIVKEYEGIFGSLEINKRHLEIDQDGKTTLRYWGGEKQFPHVSLANILKADDSDSKMRKIFENKLVFVGSTASGAHDLRHTPLSPNMPGVLAHINAVHMLIHGYFFKPNNDSLKYSLILLFLGTLIFIIIHRYNNPLFDALTVMGLLASSYYFDSIYFLPEGYQLKLFYCYFCFVATYSWNTFLNFYEANREKRQIKGTFARYVAPTVVNEMLKDPDNIQVGGRKMDITCLFSDVRDFTSISETLSAQDLANVLNDYMSRMTDIVFDTKGTLDKYIGDAIVAIWGAPLPIGNHAQHAVEAAILMAETMPGMNEDFRKRGLPHFDVGIGLNTGECSVGNMGSTRIFSYTALGDNMNLGARLEGLCKRYGTQILISENTLKRIDTQVIKTRPIDKVIVKGRTQAVGIYEVICKIHFMGLDPQIHQHYLTGWQYFTQKNFPGALQVFDDILAKYPEDKPSKRLKSLCEVYIQNPALVDDSFDVTKMSEK